MSSKDLQSFITMRYFRRSIPRAHHLFLGPVHLLTQTDKWDYLQCPNIKLFCGMFLGALGSKILELAYLWPFILIVGQYTFEPF